jgi:signal transduction histidine kinase
MKLYQPHSIGARMLFWFLLIALTPLIVTAIGSIILTEQAMRQAIFTELTIIAEDHRHDFVDYLQDRERDIFQLTNMQGTRDALLKLSAAFAAGGPDADTYRQLDAEFRPFLQGFQELGYYDLFLITPAGDIVFTVVHEADFGTNLKTGPYRETQLARSFEWASTLLDTGLSDFEHYAPSAEPAAFIAAPLFSGQRFVGVVALQISTDKLFTSLSNYTGLGETGETVFAAKRGDEAVIVAPLRHDPGAAFSRTVPIGAAQALPIQKAVQGERGSGFSVDYRGREILAVWQYIPHLRWGMVVKIDTAEAFAPVFRLRQTTITLAIIVLSLAALLAIFLAGSIAGPIRRLHEGVEIIGPGKLDHRVGTDSPDEVGQLSRAFDRMTSGLRQAQEKLRIASQLSILGKVSGSIGHEIRNPLGVIDSSAYYLKMKLKDADEKTRLHLDRIKTQVGAATAIIQSLHDLVRVAEPHRTHIDPGRVIEEGLELAAPPPGIAVENAIGAGEYRIDADRQQLTMVVKNLASNAAQSMGEEGTLSITATPQADGWLDITFRDTGPGIAAENIEKIFEPLFTTKAKGMGFGLALCRIIIEKHGGTITATSTPDEGAAFVVHLPWTGEEIRQD